jgi:hypothetical protein
VRRRSVLGALALVLAAVALAVTAVALRPGNEPKGPPTGPIRHVPRGNEIFYGRGAPQGYGVGTRFSDGLFGAVTFTTKKPVTVIDVEPVGGSGEALRFLGARVVPMPRGFFPYDGFDDFLGFPRPKPVVRQRLGAAMYRAMLGSVPAEGAVLHPRMWEGRLQNEPIFLLGYEVVRDRYEIRKGVAISYEVDGHPYRAFFALRFEYCPTYRVKGTDGHCTGVRPSSRPG